MYSLRLKYSVTRPNFYINKLNNIKLRKPTYSPMKRGFIYQRPLSPHKRCLFSRPRSVYITATFFHVAINPGSLRHDPLSMLNPFVVPMRTSRVINVEMFENTLPKSIMSPRLRETVKDACRNRTSDSQASDSTAAPVRTERHSPSYGESRRVCQLKSGTCKSL
jgi:hypothetical protein